MQEVLQALNRRVAGRLIERYAIGGGGLWPSTTRCVLRRGWCGWMSRRATARWKPSVVRCRYTSPASPRRWPLWSICAPWPCGSGDSADLLRVAMFFEHGKVDRRRLTALAQRHGLLEALQMLERRLFPPLSAPVCLDARKTALNVRMKAQLRAHLQARSWEDKVAAMQAMTLALKRAREALRGATSAAAARGE